MSKKHITRDGSKNSRSDTKSGKQSINQNWNKGRKDRYQGEKNPPGSGFSQLTGAIVGGIMTGPVGVILGGLLGDSESNDIDSFVASRKSYKKGSERKK